jgi:hypothetical protein
MKRQNSQTHVNATVWSSAFRRPVARTTLSRLKAELRTLLRLLCTFALVWGFSTCAAGLPADWQHEQPFNVPASGLVKLSLPVETLDAARPALEDLRLYDDAGNEVPYLIEHPVPVVKVVQNVKSFHVSLTSSNTAIVLETGLAQPLDDVTLETPALSFLKPVRIEGSTDLKRWQPLEQGQPIFRQPDGVNRLHVSFPAGSWPWLRLTVDDQRTPPIPFTGAHIRVAVTEPAPTGWLPVTIAERDENPGETRLALNLGAANLSLTAVQIETAEPLFTRHVTFAVPQVSEDTIHEQTIGQGVIYRVAVGGQPAAESLLAPLESQVRSRELLLFIHNQDSPPLPITAVRVERRPVYLVFLARQAGAYHLLTGNGQCAAPRYDLAALDMNLKSMAVAPIQLPPPANNPDYRPPEVLPGIEATGAALDVTAWKFRQPVKLTRAGAQQLELEPDVLAHTQPGFQDLRLLHGSNQVPYILEHTSISRSLAPAVTATNDAKGSQTQPLDHQAAAIPPARYAPELRHGNAVVPAGNDPLRGTHRRTWRKIPASVGRDFLGAKTRSQEPGIFPDPRQSAPKRHVVSGNTQWRQPADYPGEISILLSRNPHPVQSRAGRRTLPVLRQSARATPSYDLSLVAGQLLSADKALASPGTEQQLLKSSWREHEIPGQGGVVFWGILALVVVVLLVIISRLLPKSPPPPA